MLNNKFCFWAPDFSDQEYDILQVHDDDVNQDLDQDHDPKDQDQEIEASPETDTIEKLDFNDENEAKDDGIDSLIRQKRKIEHDKKILEEEVKQKLDEEQQYIDDENKPKTPLVGCKMETIFYFWELKISIYISYF